MPKPGSGSKPASPTACRRATPPKGFAAHLDWERLLFEHRWAVVSWPEAYGGRDASLWQWLIFEEEYYRAGGPQRVTQNGIFLLAPTVFEFGTLEQQDRRSCPAWPPPRTCGARGGPSPTPAATWPR